jgi:hypothetical protein
MAHVPTPPSPDPLQVSQSISRSPTPSMKPAPRQVLHFIMIAEYKISTGSLCASQRGQSSMLLYGTVYPQLNPLNPNGPSATYIAWVV